MGSDTNGAGHEEPMGLSSLGEALIRQRDRGDRRRGNLGTTTIICTGINGCSSSGPI